MEIQKDRRTFQKAVAVVTFLAGISSSLAEDLKPVRLVKLKTGGGNNVPATLPARVFGQAWNGD